MTERKPYADQCTRVYTRTGKRAHLLGPFVSPNTHGSALCGTVPEWFEAWRGTGSQQETETAASLPVCRYCGKRATAEDEASRKAADVRQQRAERAS